MNVKQLAEELELKLYSGEDGAEEKEIQGCFIGDLLSLAMSRVQEGDAWITIQTNVNIVAVASLTDCACIIVADGFLPEESAIAKAKEQDVIILGSTLSVYEIVKKLVESGI